MSDDVQEMRNYAPGEVKAVEIEAARILGVWVDAYLKFPTEGNLEGVVKKMREYQTAWMHAKARGQ